MNNETPTIKLTGHFNKTFSVWEEKGYKGLDNEKTRIPVSLHGAVKLMETFHKLGFTQIEPKGYKKP